MAESVIKNYFPSQVVSDVEKLSYDYGLKVALAIEQEWFHNDRRGSRYITYKNTCFESNISALNEPWSNPRSHGALRPK